MICRPIPLPTHLRNPYLLLMYEEPKNSTRLEQRLDEEVTFGGLNRKDSIVQKKKKRNIFPVYIYIYK